MIKHKTYKFDIDPVAKPRMTRKDKWNPSRAAVNYFAFKAALKLMANLKGLKELSGDIIISFYIEMPKSWSGKKQFEMFGKPHEVKPDLDNLVKSIFDILSSKSDSHIYRLYTCKFWNDKGEIHITI